MYGAGGSNGDVDGTCYLTPNARGSHDPILAAVR